MPSSPSQTQHSKTSHAFPPTTIQSLEARRVQKGESPKVPLTLTYIDDPAMFDIEALTCHPCNKSFKTPRAFGIHRNKHQVIL